jgi:hypothetical protein
MMTGIFNFQKKSSTGGLSYYHESFINIVNALDPLSFYSQRLMRMMVAIFGRKLNLMIEKLESYVTMPLRIH